MSQGVGEQNRRLPVFRILLEAFRLPWEQRWVFCRALAVPAAMYVVLYTGWYFSYDGMSVAVSWAIYLLSGVILVIFAVVCHRLVLLGPQADTPLIPGWSWRETRFLLWVFGIYIAYAVCFVLAQFLVEAPFNFHVGPREELEYREPPWWRLYAAGILATYVLARICLVLPATAIDHKPNVRRVWELSRHNGWRLAIIAGALPWTMSWLIGLADRADAHFAEWLFLTVAGVVLLTVEIVALSLSYRYLGKGAGAMVFR